MLAGLVASLARELQGFDLNADRRSPAPNFFRIETLLQPIVHDKSWQTGLQKSWTDSETLPGGARRNQWSPDFSISWSESWRVGGRWKKDEETQERAVVMREWVWLAVGVLDLDLKTGLNGIIVEMNRGVSLRCSDHGMRYLDSRYIGI